MITRSNYEIYFIDYVDGRLDKSQCDQLLIFLKEHPDLKEEFDLFNEGKIIADTEIYFPSKEKLKKSTISNLNYLTWFVAYVEDDLSARQKKEVDYFIRQNPESEKDLELFTRLKFKPDEKIVFPDNNQLKRHSKVIAFDFNYRKAIAIAAIICLFILSFFGVQLLKSIKVETTEDKIATNKSENKIITKEIENVITAKAADVIHNKKSQHNNNFHRNSFHVTAVKPENSGWVEKINISRRIKLETLENPPIAREEHSVKPDINANSTADNQVFSREELDEFRWHPSLNKKKEPKTLLAIATNEINRATGADIKIVKEKDKSKNSTTYAFGVGKYFSVSHTKSN